MRAGGLGGGVLLLLLQALRAQVYGHMHARRQGPAVVVVCLFVCLFVG